MMEALPLLELSDYTLAPVGSGKGINNFYFSLRKGDVCAIDAQNPDDARSFLRALASLVYPVKGSYRFMGERMDLKAYAELLPCKQKIGYIAPDAALLSNLTLRQNILLQRYYFENDLAIDVDNKICTLCDTSRISDKLDQRPSDLNKMEVQMAIVLREVSKQPAILLLDRPESFIGHANFDMLVQLFKDWIADGKPVVFLSDDRRLIRRFANRKILITNGSLSTEEVKWRSEDAV
jgi:ABC-type ATPase involved in cell division